MHSGARICTKLSLFLLSHPPSFVLHLLAENPPPHTPSSWAVSGLWTREDWGLPGPTPRLTLTGSRERHRTVIPWAQSHSVLARPFLLCLSPMGRGWGQGRGGTHIWREALCCPWHSVPPSVRGSPGCSSFPARRTGGLDGGGAHHKTPRVSQRLVLEGRTSHI